MKRRSIKWLLALGLGGLFWLPCLALAAVIQVTPQDNYTKIEQAKAGDIVEIAPGTYKFRVNLAQSGTANNPIIIRAKDPNNRPVWDLAGRPVKDWPGSYTAGDRGRGCWQVRGGHYVIEGIIFRNCQDSASSGIRAVNSGPVTVRDCVFANSTNGVTGSSELFVVEFCEFYKNGKLTPSGNPTHNIYIFGGVFHLRYSYLYEPIEGQNLHIRARESVIEYNWLSRAASYPLDMMSCETFCGGTGTNPITQKMLLRGNVIVQDAPANRSQMIALFNDQPGSSSDQSGAVSRMELTLVHNTIIGTKQPTGRTHRLVNMRNDGVDTHVTMHNNILFQMAELAVPAQPGDANWSVKGNNNWVSTGTVSTGVSGTIVGADPGFAGVAQRNFHLVAGATARNKAANTPLAPDKEYYLNETDTLRYRLRATAQDLGAFEYNNMSPPVGPHATMPPNEPTPEPRPESSMPDASTPEMSIEQEVSLPDQTLSDQERILEAPSGQEKDTKESPVVEPPATEKSVSENANPQDSNAPEGVVSDAPSKDTTQPSTGGCQCHASSTENLFGWLCLGFFLLVFLRVERQRRSLN